MKTKDLSEMEVQRMERLDGKLDSPGGINDFSEDDIEFYNKNRMNMHYYYQEQADKWLHHTHNLNSNR